MITTEAQLRNLYAQPAERALRKELDRLDRHIQQWVAHSPLVVLATAGNAAEMLDASPRGGKPGFVKAPDAQTLLIPDAGGNNRLDSLSNLIDDPRLGLLFFVPGFDETLRVNGTAQLRDEAHYTALFASDHFRPRLVIEVNVQEAYLHCAKALMRSRLWSAEAQVPRKVMPTLNQMIQSQLGMTGEPESQELMMARYGAVIAAEQGKQN